jgi:sugar-specific transcriptional regulator TrmB
MSLERLLQVLAGFGLKRSDAIIYVFLAKNGPCSGKDLATALNLPKWQLYSRLGNLTKRQIISATTERPAFFSAVPFEKIIDLLIRAKIDEAQLVQENIENTILDWRLMLKEDLT